MKKLFNSISKEALKERLSLAIKFQIGSSDPDSIKAFEYILEPLIDYLQGHHSEEDFPSRLLDGTSYINKIKERGEEKIIENPTYDFLFSNNLQAIISYFNIDFLNNPEIPNIIKAIASQGALNLIVENEIALKDSEDTENVTRLKDFHQKNIERYKASNIGPKSIQDLIDQKRQEMRREPFLFDIKLLDKLDIVLRQNGYIDQSSPILISVFHQDDWVQNDVPIEWEKSQQSLVFLLLTLNKNNTKIPHGTISELISKSFTVKGSRLTQSSVQKVLSKTRELKASHFDEILDMLKQCDFKF